MKILSLILSPVFVILVLNETRAQAFSNPEAEVRVQFDGYMIAWNNRDSVKLASDFIRAPINLGGWRNTPEEVIQGFNYAFNQMGQQGWTNSKTISINLCTLSETLVLLENEYSRLKVDGSLIDGPPIRRAIQVWQKIKDEWRIIAFYPHDPSVRISCEK